MEVEEVQRPCERVAHSSGRNSSVPPATAATGTVTSGSIMCVYGKPQLCLLFLPLAASPKWGSKTSNRSVLSHRFYHNSTSLEGDSTTNNHCYLTPCRLPGVWRHNLQPPRTIAPFLSHPHLIGVRQPNSFATTQISHTFMAPRRVYHPGNTLYSIAQYLPILSPRYAVYHPPGVYISPGDESF